MNLNENPTKPLYMWAGGKTKLIKHYRDMWPDLNPTVYVEPFFGGGAVYSWLKTNNPDMKAVIGDINKELTSILSSVKTRKTEFQKQVETLTAEYLNLNPDKETRKQYYYELRQKYWNSNGTDTSLLYFLMKLGFNGIWQTCRASNGLYGTPAGLLNHTNPQQILNTETLNQWHSMLQNTTIQAVPYNKLQFNPKNALIYLDPPYRNSFTDYSTGFGDKEQEQLVVWAKKQAEAGATVLLANRCVEGENFFEHLLPEAEFHYFNVTYTAGRRKQVEGGYEAKPAKEFLAMLKPS